MRGLVTQLDQFSTEQILESRLYQAGNPPSDSQSKPSGVSFLDDLAAASPAPGGGSAAAYAVPWVPPWLPWWQA